MSYSITGWICDERRGKTLQDIVKYIPSDRLMIETDAPFLTPRTIGKQLVNNRNEPAFLTYVLDQLAKCMNCSPDELALITKENTLRFFGIKG